MMQRMEKMQTETKKRMKITVQLFPLSVSLQWLPMHSFLFLPMTTIMRMKRRNLFLSTMDLLFIIPLFLEARLSLTALVWLQRWLIWQGSSVKRSGRDTPFGNDIFIWMKQKGWSMLILHTLAIKAINFGWFQQSTHCIAPFFWWGNANVEECCLQEEWWEQPFHCQHWFPL